jgi:hypothetical protein
MYDVKVCFWTLSIVLFLFQTQRFEHWILSISVGFTRRQRQIPLSETLLLNKNRTMDNVQKHNTCVNVPLSQTFRAFPVLGKGVDVM